LIVFGIAEGGFGWVECCGLNGVSIDFTYVEVGLDLVDMLRWYVIRGTPDFLFWRRYVLVGSAWSLQMILLLSELT
jgi:hypothetical protein